MKNKEVIEKIIAYHPPFPEDYSGCDGYKCGSGEAECTGIAAALVPTVEVIREAIRLGCSLIVTHEPLYFQSPDFPEWRGCFENSVYEEKKKLLEDNGITVWRDHDRMHAHEPDSIFTGVLKYLGWESFFNKELSEKLPFCHIVDLPECTVEELAEKLKKDLKMNGLRYIGRKSDKIRRAAIVGHIYPNSFYPDELGSDGFYRDHAMTIIRMMEENEVDAILPGEIIEWNTLAYIKDAVSLGKTRACFNIGHFNMEELGMRYAADWIGELINHELPIRYIPTPQTFDFL